MNCMMPKEFFASRRSGAWSHDKKQSETIGYGGCPKSQITTRTITATVESGEVRISQQQMIRAGER